MSGDPFVPEHDPVGADGERPGVVEDATEAQVFCSIHPDERATWFCGKCGTMLCEACVRVYAAKDQRHASCRACGSRCSPLLDRYVDPDNRAGAIESPEQRRRRILRDVQVPAVILAGAMVLLIPTMSSRASVLPGLLMGLAIVAFSTGAIGFAYMMLCRVIGADFEPARSTWLKMAAISASSHLARNVFWITLVGVPPGPVAGSFGLWVVIAMAVSFVLLPLTVVTLLVSYLFEHDVYERMVSIVAIFLADALTIAIVVSTLYGE